MRHLADNRRVMSHVILRTRLPLFSRVLGSLGMRLQIGLSVDLGCYVVYSLWIAARLANPMSY